MKKKFKFRLGRESVTHKVEFGLIDEILEVVCPSKCFNEFRSEHDDVGKRVK